MKVVDVFIFGFNSLATVERLGFLIGEWSCCCVQLPPLSSAGSGKGIFVFFSL